MPVRVKVMGAIAEVHCIGDCDLESAPEVEVAISHVMRRGLRLLLLDLSRARYMDSRGVRMLLWARGEVEASAGRMAVVGLQWQPRRALGMVGLQRVLCCVTDRQQAVAYLTQTPGEVPEECRYEQPDPALDGIDE